MFEDKSLPERRAHPRLKVIGREPLVSISSETLNGAPVDISMGGMSFFYRGVPFFPGDGVHYCSLVGCDDLWLVKMPVKTISDYIVQRRQEIEELEDLKLEMQEMLEKQKAKKKRQAKK